MALSSWFWVGWLTYGSDVLHKLLVQTYIAGGLRMFLVKLELLYLDRIPFPLYLQYLWGSSKWLVGWAWVGFGGWVGGSLSQRLFCCDASFVHVRVMDLERKLGFHKIMIDGNGLSYLYLWIGLILARYERWHMEEGDDEEKIQAR